MWRGAAKAVQNKHNECEALWGRARRRCSAPHGMARHAADRRRPWHAGGRFYSRQLSQLEKIIVHLAVYWLPLHLASSPFGMIADRGGRAAISAPRTATYQGGGGGGRRGGGGGGEKGAPPTTNDDRPRDAVCVCVCVGCLTIKNKQPCWQHFHIFLEGCLLFSFSKLGMWRRGKMLIHLLLIFTVAHFCHDIILCTLESCGVCKRLEGDRASGRVFPFLRIKKQPCFSLNRHCTFFFSRQLPGSRMATCGNFAIKGWIGTLVPCHELPNWHNVY